MELRAIIDEFVKRGAPVIPVVLAGRDDDLKYPLFLNQFHAIDYQESDPNPLEQLIWGITGERGPR